MPIAAWIMNMGFAAVPKSQMVEFAVFAGECDVLGRSAGPGVTAQNATISQCYHTSPDFNECIYCSASGQSPTRRCTILPGGTGNSSAALCEASTIGGRDEPLRTPGVFVVANDPLKDVDINFRNMSFFTIGTLDPDGFHHRYLHRAPKLLFKPCVQPVCGTVLLARWVCFWYIHKEPINAWRLMCNKPVTVPVGTATADQQQNRAIGTVESTRARLHRFIHFNSTGDNSGHCFQFDEQYCWTLNCVGNDEFDCLGGKGPSREHLVELLSAMTCVVNISVNPDNVAFPHRNKADLEIKNHIWDTYGQKFTRIFAPGHSETSNYDSPNIDRWQHSGAFTGTDPESGDDEPNPKVRLGGTGAQIRIWVESWNTGIRMPAWLTLHKHTYDMRLSVDRSGIVLRRVGGIINISLDVRVELDRNSPLWPASLPFNFTDPNDPYSLLIDDPDDVLIVKGPNDERIPTNLVWRGFKGPKPFSAGSWRFDQGPPSNCQKSNFVTGCCYGLHAIDGTNIFGEYNDFAEGQLGFPTVPQRFKGGVTLLVEQLNESSPRPSGFTGVSICDCDNP